MTAGTVGPKIAAALVALQAEAPKVHKGKTARIPGKNGGPGYTYQYADLSDVTDAARPLLAKHGLAFVCHPRPSERGWELAASLVHESGESITGSLPLNGGNAQAVGSDLTYHRRYLLGCLTGIVTDEDDDGAAGSHGDRTTPQELERQRQAEREARQAQAQDTADRLLITNDPAKVAQVRQWCVDHDLMYTNVADADGLVLQLGDLFDRIQANLEAAEAERQPPAKGGAAA
jgi:hypothetical protein